MIPLPLTIAVLLVAFLVLVSLIRSSRIVTAQTVLVVERLGRYTRALDAGFHILIPFIDRVRFQHNMKEQAVDVPAQPCFTHDNVNVDVDGVLYFRVVDPRGASYGIKDYRYATIQLAQTTMRSVIGKLELDRTFEEREKINSMIVKSLDEATEPWGVKVTRYEIQNIKVPESVLDAMEFQLRAERERRAVLAKSVGEMQSRINHSIGVMEESINRSEGEKQRQINEAEGRAKEIETLAGAGALEIQTLADALRSAGGEEAMVLRIAEQYIDELRKLARENTDLVLPLNLSDIRSVVAMIRGTVHTDRSV